MDTKIKNKHTNSSNNNTNRNNTILHKIEEIKKSEE